MSSHFQIPAVIENSIAEVIIYFRLIGKKRYLLTFILQSLTSSFSPIQSCAQTACLKKNI